MTKKKVTRMRAYITTAAIVAAVLSLFGLAVANPDISAAVVSIGLVLAVISVIAENWYNRANGADDYDGR